MADAGNHQVLDSLQTIFLHQWRSLPHYLLESWPWTHSGDAEAHASLRAIGTAQMNHAQRLAEFLQSRGEIPLTRGYPLRFSDANYHYVSLDFLLRELVADQRQALSSLEHARPRCAGDLQACALVDDILADERKHLQILERLVETHAWPRQVQKSEPPA